LHYPAVRCQQPFPLGGSAAEIASDVGLAGDRNLQPYPRTLEPGTGRAVPEAGRVLWAPPEPPFLESPPEATALGLPTENLGPISNASHFDFSSNYIFS